MRISVFGMGYVGTVSGACLAEFGHTVVGVDVAAEKVAMLNRGMSPIVEDGIEGLIADAVAAGRFSATTDADAAVASTDISFVSVGTPSAASGSISLAAVDEVVNAIGRAIGRKPGGHVVAMRSTVPPGTAEERVIPSLEAASGRRHGTGFRYYSNPEFLREGSSVRDFRAPPFVLLGAPPGDDAPELRALYESVRAPLHVVRYRIAESVKYLSNVYHAVKLAFANEAGAVLAAYGADAREAFRLFCEDRQLNISAAYLRPGFAFGGPCLPKDLRSFLALADARNLAAPFLRQLLPSNQAVVDRAFAAIERHGRQRVGLFGLAFKEGTDDLRDSPFVALAERLIGRGFELRIFDRSVDLARLVGSNRRYIEREIPHLERLLIGNPEAALQDSRIAVIGHIAPADQPALIAALDGHTVIDLAGIEALREHPAIAYQGICW